MLALHPSLQGRAEEEQMAQLTTVKIEAGEYLVYDGDVKVGHISKVEANQIVGPCWMYRPIMWGMSLRDAKAYRRTGETLAEALEQAEYHKSAYDAWGNIL